MCGVAAALSLTGALSPADREVVRRLDAHQRRRGPDGEGSWTSPDGRAALGHRRLAIIDLDATGAQPMTDASGRWTIAFNGEIYNYRELAQELAAAGRTLRTRSDTEVLMGCVAQWGEAGLRKLRGMYAFALWDDLEKELWLARDPFGVKPLYYAAAGARLFAASQARALATCAPVDTDRRAAGLVGFYLWGAVPDPFTWWRGVSALPAGHLLRIRPGRDIPAPRSFLAIEDFYAAAPAEPISPAALEAALMDSVAAHFVADAPVGLFLSAGVDSTVLAALAAKAGFPLRTVTLAFDEFAGAPEDEAPAAEETARRIGARHETVRVGEEEFFSLYDELMAAMDQPTTDGLNAFLVSRAAAAAGLKVALSGLGGDELFGGYPSFRHAPRLVSLASRLPARAALGGAFGALARPLAKLLDLSPKLASTLDYAGDLESAYCLRRWLYLPEELDLLADAAWVAPGLEELAETLPGGAEDARLASLPPHAAISRLEIRNYMRIQPLRDIDWASMAHSVEVRVPFLDLPLFATLAPAIASRRPPSKADLAACAGPFAERLATRGKTGFVTPVARWMGARLREGRGLRPWADEVAASFGYRARWAA